MQMSPVAFEPYYSYQNLCLPSLHCSIAIETRQDHTTLIAPNLTRATLSQGNRAMQRVFCLRE